MKRLDVKNRSKLLRKRFLHRLRIFLKFHLKRSEKEPVFILTARRTGSNLLLSYLNSVPGVSFAPEILNRDMSYGLRSRFVSKRTVLNHLLYSIHDCRHRVCGAKIVKIQMENHRLGIEDFSKTFPRAKFIVLYRESLLEQYVSLRIAEITDTWSWKKDFRPPLTLRIDPAAFRGFCETIRNFYDGLLGDAWLRGRMISLSYEELVRDPQAVFDQKVVPFLGRPCFPISSRMMKQNTRTPRQIVENFEEIEPFADESIHMDSPVDRRFFERKELLDKEVA